ncbi:hypothetical protein BGZ94_007246 [Podila epigama]|nr:hypothetical protein BGZ94_007246 [Podila epigama]
MPGYQGDTQGLDSRNQHNYTLGSKQEFHEQPVHGGAIPPQSTFPSTSQSTYPNNNYGHQQQQQQPQRQYHNRVNENQGPGRQPTEHQLQQLELQRQHQLQLQEQMTAEDSLRNMLQQQHRVPRETGVNTDGNSNTSSEAKPPNYYSYPPQPHASEDETGPEVSTKSLMRRLFGFPCSTYGKSLILVVGIEALLVIVMQAVVVAFYFNHLGTEHVTEGQVPYLDPKNQSRSIPAYMLVFVFAQLFQLVLAWDAVRAQNTIEIIGIVIFNLCCFAYSIFEISQIKSSLCIDPEDGSACVYDSIFFPPGRSKDLLDSIRPFLIVVVVVIGVTQLLVTWLAYQLFQEFGWKIYKKIGADPNMKKMYRAYQIYLVLIKIDLFFFVGFSIQFIYLTLANRSADPEYWVTIFVLPVTILILMVAVYAVRHESRRWMSLFMVTMLAGVGYFIFKIVRMHTPPKMDQFNGIRKFLTLFVTILATIANAAVCYRNFGKGLKPHILRQSSPNGASNTTAAPNGRVLEID